MESKHIVLGLTLTFSCLFGFGQRHEVEINLDSRFNSNFVSNSFYNSFFTDGYLSTSEKADSRSKLGDNNLFFQQASAGVKYTFQKDSSLAYTVGLKSQLTLWGKLDSDLFNLAMDGNVPYKGQTLSVPESFVRDLRYEALRVGLEKELNKRIQLNGGLSLLKSGYTNTQRLTDASFYTADDGSQVTLSGSYRSDRTYQEGKSTIGLFKGFGTAIDAEITYTLDSASAIYGGVQDLGFIRYGGINKEDTVLDINYTGYEIDNIFSDVISTSDFELIDVNGFTSNEAAQSIWLPSTFYFGYVRSLSTDMSMDASVHYITLPKYSPLLRLKINYEFPGLKLNTFLIQQAGGYSNYDIIVGLKKDFGDWSSVRIQANYVESLLLPKQSTSQSYNLAFVSYF